MGAGPAAPFRWLEGGAGLRPEWRQGAVLARLHGAGRGGGVVLRRCHAAATRRHAPRGLPQAGLGGGWGGGHQRRHGTAASRRSVHARTPDPRAGEEALQGAQHRVRGAPDLPGAVAQDVGRHCAAGQREAVDHRPHHAVPGLGR